MNIAVYLGSSFGADGTYKEMVKELGTWMGENHHTLVYGGGQAGLMGVVADAVLNADGSVIGVIPHFLAAEEIAHEKVDELYEVDTMAQRKTMMKNYADAFIALPGGPGTLEEISEIISEIRLKIIEAPCIIFNISHFYDSLQIQCQKMVEEGFVDQASMDRISFVESMDEIISVLKE